MSDFSIYVNWQEDYEKNYEKWENLGRQALENGCKHTTQDDGIKRNRSTNMQYSGYCEECGAHEDSAVPMMNYAYPLHCHYDINDSEDLKKILKVVRETCLTVMYNTEEDAYYLALCGGGMDLSQDIAYAYFILGRWIPFALLIDVCTQPELSVYGSKWLKLAREMKTQLSHYSEQAARKQTEITKGISQYNKMVAARKVAKKGV